MKIKIYDLANQTPDANSDAFLISYSYPSMSAFPAKFYCIAQNHPQYNAGMFLGSPRLASSNRYHWSDILNAYCFETYQEATELQSELIRDESNSVLNMVYSAIVAVRVES